MIKGGKKPVNRLSRLLVLSIFLMLCSGGNLWAEARKEYVVKAAFVYNFIKFSTWKNSSAVASDGTYNLCVIADQSLRSAFSTIDGKKIGKHLLHVHYRRPSDSADNCDVLFFSREIERKVLLRSLRAVRNKPVLTIGEIPEFAKSGGVVNLTTNEKGGVGFEINRTTARQQNLEISSRILRLATIVDETDSAEKREQK